MALLGMLVLGGLNCGAQAQENTDGATPALSDYDRAVQAYAKAAVDQLRDIRKAVDARVAALSKPEDKKRFDAVYQQLDACDAEAAKLKSARQGNFDTIKRDFEQKRAQMVKTLDETTGT